MTVEFGRYRDDLRAIVFVHDAADLDRLIDTLADAQARLHAMTAPSAEGDEPPWAADLAA